MDALFIELSSFQKYRANYLNNDQYRLFQNMLLADPEKGDVIPIPADCVKFASGMNVDTRAHEAGSGFSITGPTHKAIHPVYHL